MPIGQEHSFKNESDTTAKMIITFAPAGLEEMFFEAGQELADGELPDKPSPEEIQRLLKIAGNYGIEYNLPSH